MTLGSFTFLWTSVLCCFFLKAALFAQLHMYLPVGQLPTASRKSS